MQEAGMTDRVNRRDVLKAAGVGALALSLGGATARAQQAQAATQPLQQREPSRCMP